MARDLKNNELKHKNHKWLCYSVPPSSNHKKKYYADKPYNYKTNIQI